MNILSFDTSSANLSICISWQDRIVLDYNQYQPKTSMELVKLLEASFRKKSLAIEDLDLLVLGQGPGSFTGLRIAFSIAKAWSLVWPHIKITTLGSFYSIADQLKNKHKKIVVIADARKDSLYAASYDVINDKLKLNNKEILTNINDFIPKHKDYTFVTYDSHIREHILSLYSDLSFYSQNVFPLAKSLIAIATETFANQQLLTDWEPLYLHPKTCQIKTLTN